MPKIKINDNEIEVENGISILQACESIGIEIPRFCYHEKLSIAGNCRMCLVELEGSQKPVASCAMPVNEGMVIKTSSEFVKKARNSVMEFLLINHPLDCPVCDQGGECDLQDQAMAYGKGISRYFDSKRAVKNKDLGPIIKTHMTRCIHCTRCVRFGEEVCGIDQIGAIGRGEDTEITTFLEEAVDSELSGNVIDLCPVGALTSKPYAFVARPWELKKIDSVDVMDGIGSNIRIDLKGEKILRVQPRINEDINEEWISDKTRYAYDGILNQRIDRPYQKIANKFEEISNDQLFSILKNKLEATNASKIAAIAGNILDCETIFSFKEFLKKINCQNYDSRQDNAFFIPNDRSSYIFNTSISSVEESDLCLLIGSDPKIEAPILNARIRKTMVNSENFYPIGRIGYPSKLNYNVQELGSTPDVLEHLINGKHSFSKVLKKSIKPLYIIGQGALCRGDSEKIFNSAKKLYLSHKRHNDWNGFNILQTYAGRVGALDLEFYSENILKKENNLPNSIYNGEFDILYLLAADELDFKRIPESTFVVYHGHHGDKGAQNADLIIPMTCFTEKEGIFLNTEGRPQVSTKVRSALSNVDDAWLFFKKFANYLNLKLSFSSFDELRSAMFEKYPIVRNIDKIQRSQFVKPKKVTGKFFDQPIISNISNFYMTDSVSRHSNVMAECTRIFKK